MIESSFLSSSPWDSDPFQDLELIPDVSSFDMEELSWCELDNESFKLSGSSSPVDICSSSSEFDCLLPVSDTFVSEILDGENVKGFSDLDWHSHAFAECEIESEMILDNTSHTSYNPAFKSDPFEWILKDKKLWSKMTPSEQLHTLHALSDIVTYHMSIGEQMHVIKVIDPRAVISPDDKEFALDATNLTDRKLRKIKELIGKHKKRQLPESSLKTAKKSSSSKLCCRRDGDKTNFSRTKRRKQKVQRVHVLDSTHENQKRLKQNRKELKSGFFLHETKILIQKNPGKKEEDEDVNILE